jgi:uncharacterized protein DUF1592/uncharacterized protein DUF1588/uncharacterized protein DUF1587/uncharacterized protein DUF1585/uncharacterized protein DUF1595/cytochrome c
MRLAAVAILLLVAGVASGRDEAPAIGQFDAQVKPFLARHCISCHSGAKPKGDFDLEKLAPDFTDDTSRAKWQGVLSRVKSGEMPPKGRPRPPEREAKAFVESIGGQIAQGRAVVRRLNRVEYENTIRDLLGIDIELQELLPPDGMANGFDTSGEALHTSSFLMERYLEAADRAIGVAIANGPRPPLVKKRYSLKDERYVKTTTEKVFRVEGDTLFMFSSSAWNAITVGQFYPPDRGRYRIRIAARAVQSDGKPMAFRVDAGPMLMGTKNHLVDYFEVPPDKTKVIEFIDHFEARNHIRISPYGLATAQVVDKIGAEKYSGPGLAVEWVEVEGPLHDEWPPASHRRILGDLPLEKGPAPNNRNRVEVVSKDVDADAVRILQTFARRAFRRAVAEEDVQPIVALVKSKLAEQYSFEQALRVGLKAILISPEFLFLREEAGKLNDFALASRLSYFLWSTMPDDELLAVAEKKELGKAEVLHAQVERMLNHPKARAFTENFTGQWLGLRDIDFTEPSHILYPEYDAMLRVAMVKEMELFFSELLKNDLSLTNFVASDFTFLNERLAKHYGIAGVEGVAFRRVNLPPGSHRGGLLTMAGVLKVTANGTTTSPVTRGAWVLDRILGTPPPRPPADVPAIEPDIRGATTIREQLAKHRASPTCNTCHAKIDPPGFALESFDVIGGWRDNYRTSGSGKPVVVEGRRMPYHEGKKVDPSDEFNGEKFADVDEFKQLLLKDKDRLARSFTEKLLTYSTGAPPGFVDQAAMDEIVKKVRERNYGFRTLVHEIVQSKVFQTK